jgi:hypothetical protein
MFDQWTVKLGPIFFETLDSLTWTGGQQSRTIGATGDLAVSRPQQIVAAQFRQSSTIDLPLRIITFDEYQRTVVKTLSVQYPQFLAYNPTVTNGTLYIWPVPPADATIRLTSRKALSAIAALSDTVTLPPGLQEMVRYNLAMRFTPENARNVDPFVREHAMDTFNDFVTANQVQDEMTLDPMAPGGSNAWDDSNIRLYTNGG